MSYVSWLSLALYDPEEIMSADTTSQNPALPGPANRTLSIILISIFGLFLELLLIRWIGTEVRIFAYLQNTVLIVCFLGLGMGCFTSHQPARLRNILLPLAIFTLLLAIPLTHAILANITNLLSVLDDLLIWECLATNGWPVKAMYVTAGLALTLGLMVLIWEMFVPIGRMLGRLMDDPRQIIWVYSVNVASSLVGIWLFVGLSAFSLPPVLWLVIACGLLLPMIWKGPERMLNLGLSAAVIAGAWFAGYDPEAIESHWSPYQKLVLKEAPAEQYGWHGKMINVNNA